MTPTLIYGIISFLLTIMVLSYLIGDNVFFRFAILARSNHFRLERGPPDATRPPTQRRRPRNMLYFAMSGRHCGVTNALGVTAPQGFFISLIEF